MTRKPKSSFSHGKVAMEIHGLLDIPLDDKGDPDLGFKIVRIIIDTMKKALQNGETVKIPGFGYFKVHQRVPRCTGYNFITPTLHSPVPITFPPKSYVNFYPYEALLAMINIHTPSKAERLTLERWSH